MKVLLILLLPIMINFAGCAATEAETDLRFDELIIGQWEISSEKFEYLAGDGLKLFEEKRNGRQEVITFRNDHTFFRRFEGTYKLSADREKRFLHLYSNGDSLQFQILRLNKFEMTLVNEYSPAAYYENNILKSAEKAVLTVLLLKSN